MKRLYMRFVDHLCQPNYKLLIIEQIQSLIIQKRKSNKEYLIHRHVYKEYIF